MGNHFHLLVKIIPEHEYTDDEIVKRYEAFYGKGNKPTDGQIPILRKKWSSLSEYIKDIKQTFSRFYNKTHRRKGFFWSERFKSLIVEKGETLINCLAYIDLNPVRAGMVDKPENYRWNSLGYHIQTGNPDGFLSADFGLAEFNVRRKRERIRRYRKYVYETGAIQPSDKANSISHSSDTFVGCVDESSKYSGCTSASASPGRLGLISNAKMNQNLIQEKIVKKERKRDYQISRTDRFLYRTRYFSDSGIIGSKEFVSSTYLQFKHLFMSKHEKKPRAVKGLEGVFSLKRLSEAI